MSGLLRNCTVLEQFLECRVAMASRGPLPSVCSRRRLARSGAAAVETQREAERQPEMVTIKYDDSSAAFDFVSFAAPMEHRAYVSLDTGAIYWISQTSPIDEEDLPDDLDTSDRYIAVPHKNELDLGNNLALRFVEEQLPDRYANVVDFFRRRGAYARFKELLSAEKCLEKWYAFEAESTERALRHWCKANEIHLAENGSQQSAKHGLQPTASGAIESRRG